MFLPCLRLIISQDYDHRKQIRGQVDWVDKKDHFGEHIYDIKVELSIFKNDFKLMNKKSNTWKFDDRY